MPTPQDDDAVQLAALGYPQELARRLGGFSNFAVSLSIICILSGGLTSFHLGFCSVGGAAIGLGWPLVCLFSLAVAATMGQVASAFPTAGGLYHWAAILGGRGWGWGTAWLNLAGLVTVLAAINVGTYQFAARVFEPAWAHDPLRQLICVSLMTASQAALNHLGIRVTSWLTDLSGYWILIVAAALTLTLLWHAETLDWSRLWTFNNFSGLPEAAAVWPTTESRAWLFVLGFLLPAYTITGFDASAHTAEETRQAALNAPRGIVRSVFVSGVCGWLMLAAVVLAMPDVRTAAEQGDGAFLWTLRRVVPGGLASLLLGGIVVAQYLCGLATVTSGSRMLYAFARDGGVPFSYVVRRVSRRFAVPGVAIWTTAIAAVLFTVSTPVYSTITAVCTILLYLSYVVPIALGVRAHGKTWTQFGPWQLGRWFRPLAVVSVVGCGGLVVVGLQPPNEKAFFVVGATLLLLCGLWYAGLRQAFPGPPNLQSIGSRDIQR